MLTRIVSLAVAFCVLTLAATPAAADDLVDINKGAGGTDGTVAVRPVDESTRPGGLSGGAGATSVGLKRTGKRTCTYLGKEVDCTSSTGVWSQEQQCWVQRMSPQPPADDPIWAGHDGGTIYWCQDPIALDGVMGGGHMFWAPSAGAAGAPVLVDPVTLAEEAVDRMNLRAIQVGITPPEGPDSYTLVGIPTWMWVDEPGPVTWGPITRTASAGSVTVTATARVASVVWDMGDGTVVSCGKGTPYQDAYGADESPTCGHRYAAPGRYPVTATSNWDVDWSGAGQSGTISFTLTRDASIWVRQAHGLISQQG